MDIGHVAQVDDSIADLLDRDVVESVDGDGCGIGLDHEIDGADLLIADRQHDVLGRKRVGHIGGGQAMLQQFSFIEIDLDIRRGAPIGRRYRDARD